MLDLLKCQWPPWLKENEARWSLDHLSCQGLRERGPVVVRPDGLVAGSFEVPVAEVTRSGGGKTWLLVPLRAIRQTAQT